MGTTGRDDPRRRRHVRFPRRRTRIGQTPLICLSIERLEPRHMLSAVSWTGGGNDNDWSNPANWSGNSLPGAADDVTINPTVPPNTTLTITHASGADTINSLNSPNSQVDLNLSGGSLAVLSNATVNGHFTDSAALKVTGGTSQLNGGVTSTGGQFVVDASARLEWGGVLSLDSATSITGAGLVVFDNTSPLTFSGTFNSSGETDLIGDVTFTQSFTAGSGNSIGSNLSVLGTETFVEGGDFTLQGLYLPGTILAPTDPAAAPATITVTSPNDPNGGLLRLTESGTLRGRGTLTVAPDATVEITPSVLNLDGWNLVQDGTASVDGNASSVVLLDDNAQWINQGELTTTQSLLFAGTGAVINSGQITTSGGLWCGPISQVYPYGLTAPAGIPTFTSTGTLTTVTGATRLDGGVTSTGGQFVVDASARLEWGGVLSLDSATSITGAGLVVFDNTSPLTFSGTFNSSGETDLIGDVTFTQSFTAGSGNSIGSNLSVLGTETFVEGGDFTLQGLYLPGTILAPTDPAAAPATITVTSPNDPNGGLLRLTESGTLRGRGTLTVAPDATVEITPSVLNLDGWNLVQDGTASVDGNASSVVLLDDNAQWINQGELTTTQSLLFAGTGAVINSGQITTSGGLWCGPISQVYPYGLTAPAGIPTFTSTGTLTTVTGATRLDGGVTSTGGQFVVDASARLEWGGVLSLDSATSITGAGLVVFDNTSPLTFSGTFNSSGETDLIGDVTFTQSFTAGSGNSIGSNLSVLGTETFVEGGDFTLQGLYLPGTILAPTDPAAAPATITVTSPNDPNGGLLRLTESGTLRGRGTLTVAPDATVEITPSVLNLDGWNLVQDGECEVIGNASSTVLLYNGAQWRNAGTLTTDESLYFAGSGTFANSGTIIVLSGLATVPVTQIYPYNLTSPTGIPTFVNSGTVDVNTGYAQFNGDVTASDTGSGGVRPFTGMSSSGQFIVDAGATLIFTGTVTSGATISGSGNVYFVPSTGFFWNGSAFTITGNVSANGNFNLNTPIQVDTAGTTIDTKGNTVTFSGALFGGSATGPLVKTGAGTLALDGSTSDSLSGDIHVMDGALVLAGDISAETSTVNVVNNSSGAGKGLFIAGTAPLQLVGNITGSGSLTIDSGATLAAGSIVQSDITIGAGGKLEASSGSSQISGTIVGAGTLKIDPGASLSAAGINQIALFDNGAVTIAAGNGSVGAVTGEGSLTIGGGATLTTASIEFDQRTGSITIGAGGMLTAAGTNQVQTISGLGSFSLVAGATLTANQISQTSFTIGAGGTLTSMGVNQLAGAISGTGQLIVPFGASLTAGSLDQVLIANNGALADGGASQSVGAITGAGNLTVAGGASLSAASVNQSSVAIGQGATLTAASGVSDVSGAIAGLGRLIIDAGAALSAGSLGQVSLINNGSLEIVGFGQGLGAIAGGGVLTLDDGASMNAPSINQGALVIGAGSVVTIDASNGNGEPQVGVQGSEATAAVTTVDMSAPPSISQSTIAQRLAAIRARQLAALASLGAATTVGGSDSTATTPTVIVSTIAADPPPAAVATVAVAPIADSPAPTPLAVPPSVVAVASAPEQAAVLNDAALTAALSPSGLSLRVEDQWEREQMPAAQANYYSELSEPSGWLPSVAGASLAAQSLPAKVAANASKSVALSPEMPLPWPNRELETRQAIGETAIDAVLAVCDFSPRVDEQLLDLLSVADAEPLSQQIVDQPTL